MMNRILGVTIPIIWLMMMVPSLGQVPAPEFIQSHYLPEIEDSHQDIPHGCTVFTISKGKQVFFGGNDDYFNPDSYYWVDPGEGQNYGVIWIGQPDNVQQGVNECGLAYDANGLPRADVNPHGERMPVPGGYTSYPVHILHECATVVEVIEWVKTHRWHSFMHDQMHFADANGDAVIISAGSDGELAFTRKEKGDGFLVSTNFNIANHGNGFSYPCRRYDLARELLGQLVNQEGSLNVQDVTAVLDAVHQEGVNSWTIESMLADLSNGVIYLYYFYQYDRPVILNIKEEIANPGASGPLSRLFPDDVQREAASRYDQLQVRGGYCKIIGMSWAVVVMLSLVLFFVLPSEEKKRSGFWIPAIIFLGPLALFGWIAGGRRRKPGTWRIAIVEMVGDLLPTAVALIAFLAILVHFLQGYAPWPLQVLLLFGLPLLLGWLVFPIIMFSPLIKKEIGQFLARRLPHSIISVNMGMAGMVMITMTLVNLSIRICPVMPISPWTLITWFAMIFPAALVSGLAFLFIYEYRTVKDGFRAWSIFSPGEKKEIGSKSWRKLWWWILLSFAVLFICLLAGVYFQQ